MQSEQINDIAKALAAAQAEITGAKKSGMNPHLKSKYADLEDAWDAIREPLSKNGLSVWQGIVPQDDGPALRTLLMHQSGQWLESIMPMVFKDASNPQVVGTVISYYRRYALKAAVGLYDTDDDGASAARQGQKRETQQVVDMSAPGMPTVTVDLPTYMSRIAQCLDINLLRGIVGEGMRQAAAAGDMDARTKIRDAGKLRADMLVEVAEGQSAEMDRAFKETVTEDGEVLG